MSLKHRLFRLLTPFTKPRMLWGYRNHRGKYLKNVRISTHTFIDHRKKLLLGDHVFIGHHNYLEASHGISIGTGCQVTNFISITTHSSHQSIRLYGKHYTDHKEHKGYIAGPVEIGAYTFVGPHVVIMPGSTIGKGSLVAAYSYVAGSFPDYSVLKGNPARVVGNTRDTDAALLEEFPELAPYYNEWQ